MRLTDDTFISLGATVHLIHFIPKIYAFRLIIHHIIKASPAFKVIETESLRYEFTSSFTTYTIKRCRNRLATRIDTQVIFLVDICSRNGLFYIFAYTSSTT